MTDAAARAWGVHNTTLFLCLSISPSLIYLGGLFTLLNTYSCEPFLAVTYDRLKLPFMI